MSSDEQKSDRWKKIRRGLSRPIKKTAELKKELGGSASDGVFTYTPKPSDRASAASGSSDTFTVAVSDGSVHLHGGLGIGIVPIKPHD